MTAGCPPPLDCVRIGTAGDRLARALVVLVVTRSFGSDDSPYADSGFLPWLPRVLVPLLRVVGKRILGYGFTAQAWDELARECGLPLSSWIARQFCGSFALALFVAGVGPEPTGSGARFRFKGRQLRFADEDEVLLAMLLAARLLGEWPPADDWNGRIKPYRATGYKIPYRAQFTRILGCGYPEARRRAVAAARRLGVGSIPHGNLPSAATADEIAQQMMVAEDLLGRRPNVGRWNALITPLREEGYPVPHHQKIYKYFGSWTAAWDRVDELRNQDGACGEDAAA